MNNMIEDNMMKDEEENNMTTMALRQALQSLMNMPDGSLPPKQEDNMLMAQAQGQQEAQMQQDALTPPAGAEPLPTEPTPQPAPQDSGLFGGKKTRQEQLDEQIKLQGGR